MFEKVNRSGLIIYLYYNRDAKKLQDYGDITYHSKKHRYLQLYVPTQEVEQLVGRLSKENIDNFLIIRYILNRLFKK
ncbi:UPF0298 protein SSU98 [Streptococcus pneumoniae]|nr:DUF2129 domain-containing protein [Streptococcus pneumoniae]VIQ86671.1 UPF0298 protein SSU98 [Streptococcus pneumoniae]VPU68899.1 UPF0298 protein SSU98 [Streptococcus pneumoniae]HEU3843616.1 DUF2129 domain-containing protein [Streptococcus pneumoniae]HEV0615668.1 DUF2129 domain-containing protein [Streptococcus pneumoniae]